MTSATNEVKIWNIMSNVLSHVFGVKLVKLCKNQTEKVYNKNITVVRVSCDPMISALPFDVIPSTRSSYYCNNVYVSVLDHCLVIYFVSDIEQFGQTNGILSAPWNLLHRIYSFKKYNIHTTSISFVCGSFFAIKNGIWPAAMWALCPYVQ